MVKGRWDGAWWIGGGWNTVRFPSERMGVSKMTGEMKSVSDWINSHSLVDSPLKGASFTWSNNQTVGKASRLDRFLVSNDWMGLYREVCQLAFPKPASDHCPFLLDSNLEGWGPAPSLFELMWLEVNKFPQMIREWWKD